MYHHRLRRILPLLLIAGALPACAPTAQLANDLSAAAPISSTAATNGAIALGETIHGRIRAKGGVQEHTLTVDAGQHFTAVLGVPHVGNDGGMEVDVFYKHPVTGELEDLWAQSDVGSAHGVPGSTSVVAVDKNGTYVVRVTSRYGGYDYAGPYTLAILPATKGEITSGLPVRGELDGRGDTDDYVLHAQAGDRFTVELEVPYLGEERGLTAEVLYRHPVTAELETVWAQTDVGAADGVPGSTRIVEVEEDAAYVIRVIGRYGGRKYAGPYTVTTHVTSR